MLLDDGTEDLMTIGPVPKEFLDILPKIKYDGCEHRLFAPSKIVAVRAVYRKKTFFSFPNPHSCKVLDQLGDFTIFGCSPFIQEVDFGSWIWIVYTEDGVHLIDFHV